MKRKKNNRRSTGLALVIVGFTAFLGSCSKVPSSTSGKTSSNAVRDLSGTVLGQLAQQLSAGRQESESGFLLLDRGREALAWRLFLADHAERTLDAQYFLWKNDRLGRLFMERLMDAADRGVRVRVLVDDSMTESDPDYLAKFAAHPRIEVRLYKPFGPPHKSYALRWIDFVADFRLLNRRMHNKLYIADDRLMILGGRNIGEEYFEYVAPDVFRSRDLMGVGPIADKSSDAFDQYWNSQWTVPIELAVDATPSREDGQMFQRTLATEAKDGSNYPPGYSEIADIQQALSKLTSSLIFARSTLVFDCVPGENGQPRVPENEDNRVGKALRSAADRAAEELIAESAYLVLTEKTVEHLKTLKNRGLRLRFLTNSLAANNHTTAFVGYRKQRAQQIDLLTELYEYRPDATSQVELYRQLAPGQPVPHMGLHAKTAVFDREIVFVGSFNLDPRSENLNTEIGLLVESPELGQLVAASMLADMAPGNAWRLQHNERGQTEWVTFKQGNRIVERESEPLSSTARKLEADAAEPLTPGSEL